MYHLLVNAICQYIIPNAPTRRNRLHRVPDIEKHCIPPPALLLSYSTLSPQPALPEEKNTRRVLSIVRPPSCAGGRAMGPHNYHGVGLPFDRREGVLIGVNEQRLVR